jgi:glycosyltransferase involved in cell wall biosynthesis
LASTLELGQGLADRGHELTVVCHPKSTIEERLAPDSRLTVAPVAIRAELNPYRALQLARTIRRNEPDIVLAEKRKDLMFTIAARRLGGRFPIVQRLGGAGEFDDSRINRHLWGRELEAIIINSYTLRDRMLEAIPWLADVRVEVIHNGRDIWRHRPLPKLRERTRAELGVPDGAFVVSYHGELDPPSNVDVLVRAVAEVPRHLEVHALIVGNGPSLAETRRLTAELRAPVIFAASRTDIPEVLSAADVAAHLTTAEGFSNSVIESMACGLPVIASDASCHPEQIEDGVHGVLVPPNQWTGVADAVRWLAGDPENRARMGKAARDRATTEFGLERMIDRYEEFLRQTVDAYAAAAGQDFVEPA